MRWIREHKILAMFVILLVLLIVIFTASILSNQKLDTGVSFINQGMSVVSEKFTLAEKRIKNSVYGFFSYHQLQKENQDLKDENAQLEREIVEISLEREQLERLEELAGILNYEYTAKKFQVVTADVVSMDGANWTNVFTINCGVESGIEVGDAVVNGSGLIGKVDQTGEGWSKVVSIIDDDSKVSFKMARDRKQFGVVSGNIHGEISGYMIEEESMIAEGDVIVTSGIGTYPAGLEIGTVTRVTFNSNTMLKEISVEPAVNFRSIEKVAVIL